MSIEKGTKFNPAKDLSPEMTEVLKQASKRATRRAMKDAALEEGLSVTCSDIQEILNEPKKEAA